MDLADQSHRDRQLGEARQSVIHRPHVIDDFIDIPRQLQLEELRLGGQQVLQRTLRALDLARQHRFLADIHEDEEIWIRQSLDRSIEAAQGDVGRRQQPLQLTLEAKGWRRRQGRRNERLIIGRLPFISTGPLGRRAHGCRPRSY